MAKQGDVDPQERASRKLDEFVAGLRLTRFPDLTPELDAAAAEMFEAFAARGIQALLLKGPALARLLYTVSEPRIYSDVDVLVAPAERERAEGVLATLGYRNASSAQGIDDVGGVVHGQSWLGGGPGGHGDLRIEIDLHLWLAGARAAPQVAWEALVARRAYVDVGG